MAREAEYVLRVRIEFGDAVKRLKDTVKDASSEIDSFKKEIAESYMTAKKGGDASIATITRFKESLKDFDITRPIRSSMEIIRSSIDTIMERSGVLGKAIIGLGGAFLGFFANISRFQDEIVNTFSQLSAWFKNADGTIARLDMGARVERALNQITKVAFKTSTSLREVVSVYTQLALTRVPYSDLEKLSEVTVLASNAMGIASETMAGLIGNLRVIGGVGVKNIEDIVSNFAAVQDVVGLTNAELTDVIDTVEQLTLQVTGLGATSKQIANLAKETARLSGLFGELGLKAQRGTDIIKNLMDPTRTRENLFLLQKMGLTFADIQRLQAGQMGERELTEGMVRAAKRFREMTSGMMPIQAARIAQLYGMSMQELNRLADKGDEILAKMDSVQARSEQVLRERAAEGMAQFNKAMERFISVIQYVFSGPAVKLIGFLTDKLEKLNDWWLANSETIEKKVAAVFIDLGKAVSFVIDNFKTIAIVIGGFFAIKTVLPLFVMLGSAISLISDKIKMLSVFTKTTTTSTTSLASAIKTSTPIFLSLAGVGAVFLSLGAAIKLVASAVKDLANSDWDSIAKAGVILGGLLVAVGGITAAAVAFSAAITPALPAIGAISLAFIGLAYAVNLVTTGVKNMGEGVKTGVDSLKDLSENALSIGKGIISLGVSIKEFVGMMSPLSRELENVSPRFLELSVGVKNISEAISTVDAKNIKTLSESIDEKTVVTFEKLGESIAAMNKAAGDLNLGFLEAQSKALESIGKGAKELSIAVWVLGKTANSTEAISNISLMVKEIISSFKNLPLIMGDVEKLAIAFKEITIAIGEFKSTKIDPKEFENINKGLLITSSGLESWFKSFNSLKKVAPNFNILGEGFKQISIGIWVLGKTDFKNIGKNIEDLVKPINSLLFSIGSNSIENKNIADSFKDIIESIKGFSTINSETLDNISKSILTMGDSVSSWIRSIGEASGTFFKDVIKTATAFDMTTKSISSMGRSNEIASIAESISIMGSSIALWLRSIGDASRLNFGNVINTAKAFSIITKSIKDMFNVSGGSPLEVAKSINDIRASITDWLVALSKNATYIANVEGLGKSFKDLAEGVSMLMSSRIENIDKVGVGLDKLTPTISKVFNAMKEVGDFKIFGLSFGRDISSIGESFKMFGDSLSSITDLSVLKESEIKGIFSGLSSGIIGLFTEIKKIPAIDNEIKQLNSLITTLTSLRDVSWSTLTTINMLSTGISNITNSLKEFRIATSTGGVTNDFVNFVDRISSLKTATAKDIRSADYKTEDSASIIRNTENSNLQFYIKNMTDTIVQSIENLNKENRDKLIEVINVLISINEETRKTRKFVSK